MYGMALMLSVHLPVLCAMPRFAVHLQNSFKPIIRKRENIKNIVEGLLMVCVVCPPHGAKSVFYLKIDVPGSSKRFAPFWQWHLAWQQRQRAAAGASLHSSPATDLG